MTKKEREFIYEQARRDFYNVTISELRGESREKTEALLNVSAATLHIATVLLGNEMVNAMMNDVKDLCNSVVAMERHHEKTMASVDEEEQKLNDMANMIDKEREDEIEAFKKATNQLKKAAVHGALSREYQKHRAYYKERRDACLEVVTEEDMEKIEYYYELGLDAIDDFAWTVHGTIEDITSILTSMKEYSSWPRSEEWKKQVREDYQNIIDDLLELVGAKEYYLILHDILKETGAVDENGNLADWFTE